MRSPEDEIYTMFGTYREIIEPNRLVFTHAWEDNLRHGHEPDYATLVTIDFEERDGQTTMHFLQTGFKSAWAIAPSLATSAACRISSSKSGATAPSLTSRPTKAVRLRA